VVCTIASRSVICCPTALHIFARCAHVQPLCLQPAHNPGMTTPSKRVAPTSKTTLCACDASTRARARVCVCVFRVCARACVDWWNHMAHLVHLSACGDGVRCYARFLVRLFVWCCLLFVCFTIESHTTRPSIILSNVCAAGDCVAVCTCGAAWHSAAGVLLRLWK
jgi:hypothetical protein